MPDLSLRSLVRVPPEMACPFPRVLSVVPVKQITTSLSIPLLMDSHAVSSHGLLLVHLFLANLFNRTEQNSQALRAGWQFSYLKLGP